MKKSDEKFLTYAALGGIAALLAYKIGEEFMITLADKKNFKLAMKPVTAAITRDFGIQANILLAQSALESNWGKSGLTVKANNLFGFTGESWQKAGKPVINLPTQEFINGKYVTVNRPFRKYASWYDSAKDWATTLAKLSRYANALIYAKTGDLQAFAREIYAAGYATDIKYTEKLIARGADVAAVTV